MSKKKKRKKKFKDSKSSPPIGRDEQRYAELSGKSTLTPIEKQYANIMGRGYMDDMKAIKNIELEL